MPSLPANDHRARDDPAREALARLVVSREALMSASRPPATGGGDGLAALAGAGLAAWAGPVVRSRPLTSLGVAAAAGALVVCLPARRWRWTRLAGVMLARYGRRWALARLAEVPWSLLLGARRGTGPGA